MGSEKMNFLQKLKKCIFKNAFFLYREFLVNFLVPEAFPPDLPGHNFFHTNAYPFLSFPFLSLFLLSFFRRRRGGGWGREERYYGEWLSKITVNTKTHRLEESYNFFVNPIYFFSNSTKFGFF